MELAKQLGDLARKETGLEQYAIAKYAEALEVQPARTHLPFLPAAVVTGCSLKTAGLIAPALQTSCAVLPCHMCGMISNASAGGTYVKAVRGASGGSS